MKPNDSLPVETFGMAERFHRILERDSQALYRYYALHTKGDLQTAYELTAETFLILSRKSVDFEKDDFRSELFGSAWDVLNTHYGRKDVVIREMECGLDPNLRHMLQLLGCLPFYPREIFYLRFFADLDPKDIAHLMDKSDTAVKVIVYQTVMEFASSMNAVTIETLPWKQLLARAQSYHYYLNATLEERPTEQGIPQDVLLATHQLRTLREAISMTPEAFSSLLQDAKQEFETMNSVFTPL